MERVGYIILGAILAVFGGIATQIILVKWGDKRARVALKILLTDIIGQINGILDNIKTTYDKTSIVYVEYLLQLRSCRVTYDRNKEHIIKISDSESRKEIFDYFDKEMLFDLIVSVLNGIKNNVQFQAYANDKIKEEVAKLEGIKNIGIRVKEKLQRL